MSITDELREWFKDRMFMGNGWQEIRNIADRIDEEHEAKVSYWQGASYKDGYDDGYGDGFASADDWLVNHEDAMAEHGWVKLPVDADGVPIRVGDVVESKGDGLLFGKDSFEVRALRCDECGWEVYNRFGDRYAPSLLRHHHEPTVEDVLRELMQEVSGPCYAEDLVLAKYAKKLRLAGDAE